MVALKYVIIGVVVVVVVVAAVLVLVLPTLHRVPVQYVGSPSGYEAFVPSSQTVNYHGLDFGLSHTLSDSRPNHTTDTRECT